MNVGEAAREKGVPTLTAFLTPETGRQVREQHGPADLVCLNNVYAHIPDVVGFTEGLRAMVADDGWVSIEVQHLLTLVEHTQFDTVYHEHFQYYTVLTGQRALASGGLTLVDVELLPTHGGSIRMWARPSEIAGEPSQAVRDVLAAEEQAGLHTAAGHDGFAEAVSRVRDDLVAFLIEARRAGKKVVGYGAPGKGNTLLNYCGIRPDLLAYTVDRNPYKHGRFTPGTRIPILAPEQIAEDQPDYVLILPWNLRDELTAQLPTYANGAAGSSSRSRTSRSSDEGRPVLRRIRHADARRRVRPPQADDDGRPAPADLARHALLRALRAQGLRAVPRLRRPPHQGLLPPLRRDGVERLRAPAAATSSCWAPTSPTGRSRSCTPASTSPIGERLRRVRKYVEDEEMFLANYADVLTDMPLDDMIDQVRGAAGQGRGVARGAAAVGVPLPRRRRRRHDPLDQHAAADADLGERRLLRPPARDLRLHPGERRPGRGRRDGPGQGGPHDGLPVPTASGSPPTRVKERTALEAAYQSGTRPWMLWDPERAAERTPLQATIAAMHDNQHER